MAREITEVWVVVDENGDVDFVCETAAKAQDMCCMAGHRIQRLPLLTPHDAAVLEAAEAYERSHGKWHDYLKLKKDRGDKTSYRIVEAIRARRAANAGGEP